METDEKILSCIDTQYKTIDEIATEIGDTYHRVMLRLNKLKIREIVYEIQGSTDARGIKPLKYRKRPA